MVLIESVVTVAGAALVLGVAPGPDNLFVITQSAAHGARVGLLVTLGLMTGLVVHTAAVAGGVAAVFATTPWAAPAVTVVGALYLAWLGVQGLRASPQLPSQPASQPASQPSGTSASPAAPARQASSDAPISRWAWYRRGVIMNLTNPKVALFFLAFLPPFADPSVGSVAVQILLLGATFLVMALLVFSGFALAAGAVGVWLARTPRVQQRLERCAGVVLLVMAGWLLVSLVR